METCFAIDIQNKMVYFDFARVCREQIFQPFNCLHAQSSITFEYFLHLNVCSTFWVCLFGIHPTFTWKGSPKVNEPF